jgi:hypothetical protein
MEDFHFPFSHGSQEVPMRVSPALQVQEESSPTLVKDVMQSQEEGEDSLNSSYCGHFAQYPAPALENSPAFWHGVHPSLLGAPESVKVFLGQILHTFAASSKYLPVEQTSQAEEPGGEWPLAGHSVHVLSAPMLKVFLGQVMRVVRSGEGMWPALAVLQKLR